MLAGSDSNTALEHAAELLADAAAELPSTAAPRRPGNARKADRKAG
jgi:hypothetical protein